MNVSNVLTVEKALLARLDLIEMSEELSNFYACSRKKKSETIDSNNFVI